MSKNTVSLVASGQAITAGRGDLTGIIVNSHSSGVIRLVDSPGGSSGRSLFGGDNGYTLATGSSVIDLPNIEYYEGVYLEVISGTVDVQITNNER